MMSTGIVMMEAMAHLIYLKDSIHRCASEYPDLEPYDRHCRDYLDERIMALAELIKRYYEDSAPEEAPFTISSEPRKFYDADKGVWRTTNDDKN